MSEIAVKSDILRKLIEGRKMGFDEFIQSKKIEINDKQANFENIKHLQKIADQLAIPVNHFFDDEDLDDGIKIGRKSDAFSRKIKRNGSDYYTYNHLVTTKNEPNLMALRVELHCRNKDQITFNRGHH